MSLAEPLTVEVIVQHFGYGSSEPIEVTPAEFYRLCRFAEEMYAEPGCTLDFFGDWLKTGEWPILLGRKLIAIEGESP